MKKLSLLFLLLALAFPYQAIAQQPVTGAVDQGAATTDTAKLLPIACVRADAAAVATGVVNGDWARCIVDATGKIWVASSFEYAQGDTAATPRGVPLFWLDASDVLRAVSALKPLPIAMMTKLDELNDHITIYASDDGGTTKRIIKTDSSGQLVISLPGSATAAKQPALGTAGASSADVISMQGISGGTPVPISGSVVVSGIAYDAGATSATTQRNILASDSPSGVGVGGTADSAATVGSTGSLNAKLRLMTSQLDAITTALQLIDNDQTGASVKYISSVGTTEDETEIKATAGRLFSVSITNTNAAVRYWRCANLTAANTTPGTSTVFIGGAIPGATTGAGITTNFGPKGIAFSTALTCWFVTGSAATDVAEVAANEIKAMFVFE